MAFWDRQDIGAGFRPVIVVSCGPKWVTLFYVPGLAHFQLSHAEWVTHHPQEYAANPDVVERLLGEQSTKFDALGIGYNRAVFHEAVAIAREAAKRARAALLDKPAAPVLVVAPLPKKGRRKRSK